VTLKEMDFPSIEAAASALAVMLAHVAQKSISEDGNAVIAVSGGQTPRMVFERLRESRMPWDKVIVTLTDERWVPNDHAESNERLVKRILLKGPAESARFIPLYGGESSPLAGLSACQSRLLELHKPIDAIYLGMGADGHIASLFPNTRGIESSHSNCVAIAATQDRTARLSLSIDTSLAARNIFLLYLGPKKHKAYLAAKESEDLSGSPLRAILNQHETPVGVLRAI
jgi:6-phosphogluconolactonase